MAKKANSTVLFVDDDKRVLKSLKMWFLSEDFKPLTASNGNDALELVVNNPVDVAVVDFRIGKEDGITVAQRLKELDEDLKIIILTGFPSYETAVQAMKIGAFDYLSKASSNDKLINVVSKAVQEREEDRALKKKSRTGDERVKLILFCNHSLIKERLENFSNTSSSFKLVKSFATLDTYGIKNLGHEVHVALICAGCNLKRLKDAYSVFPDLYRSFPGVKVLIINEKCTEQEQVDLLKLGVRGFVSQDSSSDKLEKALLHITNGELWVSRNVTQLSLKEVVSYDSRNVQKIRETFGLTMREIEILRKITQGLKNREIANTLQISETTVKTHINRIFKKMGVDNRSKAILTAMEKKIF
ncbi:MAG: response regulator [bacterium]|nr:response regulator [bacterium]